MQASLIFFFFNFFFHHLKYYIALFLRFLYDIGPDNYEILQ